MMKTSPNTSSIRNTLMAVVAVSAMALPLLASASTPQISVSFNPADLNSVQGQERIYANMKVAAREICGPTNIRALDQSFANARCFDGTLTAAVQRLDNDAVTALHSQ